MQVRNWTQYAEGKSYAGLVSGEKIAGKRSGQSAPAADSVVISTEARQAAMAAGMEKNGLSREAAQKLASGKITVNEPDWDSFEVPVLQGQADPKIYNTAYIEAYTKKLGALTERVNSYYEPEFSKFRDMNANDALDYLFTTYKLPWMKDMFVEGTKLPSPPDGMTKTEADMAYNQLKSMYFRHENAVLRDPYALGKDGMEQLNNIEKDAKEAARKAYDAAQREYDARQEAWKAERKEKYKQVLGQINNGKADCMGYMAPGQESEEGGSPNPAE